MGDEDAGMLYAQSIPYLIEYNQDTFRNRESKDSIIGNPSGEFVGESKCFGNIIYELDKRVQHLQQLLLTMKGHYHHFVLLC